MRLVQLGGLEPPTSCSTDRDPPPPPLRPSTLEYELLSIFNFKFRTEYDAVLLIFCYRGSYVVARFTNRNSNGFGKYHDQGCAGTRFG